MATTRTPRQTRTSRARANDAASTPQQTAPPEQPQVNPPADEASDTVEQENTSEQPQPETETPPASEGASQEELHATLSNVAEATKAVVEAADAAVSEPVDLTEGGKYTAYEVEDRNWKAAQTFSTLMRLAFPKRDEKGELLEGERELNTTQAVELLQALIKRENDARGTSEDSKKYRRPRQMTIRALADLLFSRNVELPADTQLSIAKYRRYQSNPDPDAQWTSFNEDGFRGQYKFTPSVKKPKEEAKSEDAAVTEAAVPEQADAPATENTNADAIAS